MVVFSPPAEAAGRALARDLIDGDQESESPLVATVGDEVEIAALLRRRRLERADSDGTDRVARHRLDGIRLEDARAVELPVVEDRAHEADVVARGRGEPGTAGDRIAAEWRLYLVLYDRAVGVAMVHSYEARLLVRRHVVEGVGHPQRLEDVQAEIFVERPAREGFDQPAEPVDAGAVVPALAGLEQQRTDGIILAGARLEVAQRRAGDGMAEARGVGHQVAHGGDARRPM